MNIALWVLQILFAALFMLHAVLHLFPPSRLKEILAEQNIPVKRTIATWAEVVASLGLILPGAVSIATWLTPLAALGLAVVMVGAGHPPLSSEVKSKENNTDAHEGS